METYLSEVARRLYAEHPDNLDNVTVVFNNRRSGLFLRRQFAAMEEKAFLLPRIIGMDELVAELGRLRIVPNEFLLFELFDIHRGINPENDKFDTFEDFISFGDMMLADFSEIDLYCVDSQQLFSNLHDLKAIGEWDIETGRLTPFQEKYLKFYQSLYQYYAQLHERLLAEGRAYSGMAYRNVAEHIDSMAANDVRKYYFVGFNAISACEERIIRLRYGIGEADTYTLEEVGRRRIDSSAFDDFLRTGNDIDRHRVIRDSQQRQTNCQELDSHHLHAPPVAANHIIYGQA